MNSNSSWMSLCLLISFRATSSARCLTLAQSSCHLQLNRGAAHLETVFAVNSRSRVPVLQLSRGAMASHFCHWARPFIPHVGAYRQARSPSYIARTAVWSLRLAHAHFRKALCI
jgi:hypothetical protein